jgi:hypothetical protein
LWLKLNEEYNNYSAKAKGGPLFLYLLIHPLMLANDSIATTLSDKINSVKISTLNGEDVGEAVTHLRANIHRLKNIDVTRLETRLMYRVQTLFANPYNNEYADSLSAWSEPVRVFSLAQPLLSFMR